MRNKRTNMEVTVGSDAVVLGLHTCDETIAHTLSPVDARELVRAANAVFEAQTSRRMQGIQKRAKTQKKKNGKKSK